MVRFLPEYELQYTQTINGKTAPKLYDPIGGGVVRSLHPITKQLLGAETKKPSNTLQKEIANLGLEEYLLYSKNRVKNPVVDLGVRYILSRNLNASFEAFIEKPLAVDNFQTMYKDVSPEQRRFLVKNFIGKQITAAESVVKDHYDSQQGRPRLQTAHARNAFNLNIAGTSKYILDSTIKSLAGKNMSMGAMAQKRADASFQRTDSAKDDAQDRVADKEGISKDTRTVEGKETLASKAKRGGGFNKGGLMKKRKNK